MSELKKRRIPEIKKENAAASLSLLNANELETFEKIFTVSSAPPGERFNWAPGSFKEGHDAFVLWSKGIAKRIVKDGQKRYRIDRELFSMDDLYIARERAVAKRELEVAKKIREERG